jgi:NTE family protein
MSTAEMEKLIATISTDELFKERPPRQDLDIRRKLDDRSILFGLEIGVKDGEILLPKGIVSGVQLEAYLRRLSKLSGYHRFDTLPIPYRAVATDLVTGKAVVFTEGELANVMRASMSVPGAIAPADVQGQLFVDGGLTDNLPVDVARAMGADIVIAVNLGTPLLRRDELKSVLGVTAQMINILTEQNVRASLASLKPTDILIEPELGEFSATDFDHLPKTVPIGEVAARKAAARLSALALPPEQYAALRARQQETPPPDRKPIDQITFEPMARVNVDVVRRTLETQPGAPFDAATVDRDLRMLYGSGDFERVNFRVIEQAGRRVLDVDAVEKSWGPNYLRFGLGLATDFKGDAFFNLAASYRRTWLNDLGGEWRTDAQVGHTTRLWSEWYQPLELSRTFFVAPSIELERRTIDLFQGSHRIARYDLRGWLGRAEAGADLGRYGEVRFGLAGGVAHSGLDTGPPEFTPAQNRYTEGALTGRLVLDRLDSANFPRDGYAASVNLWASRASLGADSSYTKWDADFMNAYSFGRHTINVGLKGAGPVGGGTLPIDGLTSWGGFLQQSGYPTGALVGQQLTFGRLVYYYKLVDTRILEGVYVGGSLELGRMADPAVPGSPTGLLKSGALFLGLDTPLGPVYLGYGHARDGNSSAYFFLGRP